MLSYRPALLFNTILPVHIQQRCALVWRIQFHQVGSSHTAINTRLCRIYNQTD